MHSETGLTEGNRVSTSDERSEILVESGSSRAAPVLTAGELAESRRYGRTQLSLALADRCLDGIVLGLMALVFAQPLDAALAAWVPGLAGRVPLLVAVMMGVHELVSFPLAFWSGFVVEHRYGLSQQSAGAWFARHLKQFGLVLVLNVAVLTALFWVIRLTGGYWWLAAAALFFLLSVAAGQLVPVLILPLFYRIERLADEQLGQRLDRLAQGTGLKIEGVYRMELSAETVKANAMLAGLGRTRRVILGDTLLDGFSPEEIEIVFAHEVGHHVHRHLPKLLVLGAVWSALGFWACDWVLRAWLGIADWADAPFPAWGLPCLMFCLWVFGLLLEPVQNAVSRHFERQSDRYALASTGRPEAYRSAFVKLARLNKDDPDPHPIEVWLMHSHPPISERLAAAK